MTGAFRKMQQRLTWWRRQRHAGGLTQAVAAVGLAAEEEKPIENGERDRRGGDEELSESQSHVTQYRYATALRVHSEAS
jgi:hypothetical protein